MPMKTTLNFDSTDTKKLLSELDFEFFLKRNIEIEDYKQADIDTMYSSYKIAMSELKKKAKENKKQFYYFCEGKVRKGFTGGFLPAHFELDEGRKNTIFRFEDIGENWAYFQYWQKFYRRKVTKEKIWDYTIKTGSILAILLSVIKLLEIVHLVK